MMMQLVYVVAVLSVVTVLKGSVIHVPDSDGNSLDYYLCDQPSINDNTMFVLQSNITLSVIERSTVCIVTGVHNITIISDSHESYSVINCSGAGFAFANVTNLSINNTVFNGCGVSLGQDAYDVLNQVPAVNGMPYYQFNTFDHVTLLFINCSHLSMYNVKINFYVGFGMILKNVHGVTEMKYVTITDAIDSSSNNQQQSKVSGSGLFVIYTVHDLVENTSIILDRFTITDGFTTGFNDTLVSDIDDGISNPNVRAAGGLSIIISEPQDTLHSVSIKIENLIVKNNRGGGIVMVYINVVQSSIVIDTANISSCLLGDMNSDQEFIGESLTVYFALTDRRNAPSLQTYCSLLLQNINFTALIADSCRTMYGNLSEFERKTSFNLSTVLVRAIGNYVGQRDILNYVHNVVLDNVYFAQDFPGITKSTVGFGIGLFVFAFGSINVYLRNVTSFGFSCSEKGYDPEDPYYSCTQVGSLAFQKTKTLEIVDGIFTHHRDCSAIYVHDSYVNFTGNIILSHNRGILYGALQLSSAAKLFFVEPLNLTMEYNTALYGGAIHVYQQVSDVCAIQFISKDYYDDKNYTSMNITLNINENSAVLSGYTIYAYPLHRCVYSIPSKIAVNISLFQLLLKRMRPVQTSNTTQVSSPPSAICFCTNNTIPTLPCVGVKQALNFSVYPGQSIQVSAVAVDGNATVYGIATARFEMMPSHVSVRLDPVTSSLAQGSCTNITYTIYHNDTNTSNVSLTIAPSLRRANAFLNLTLLNCSNGFTSVDDTCKCLPVYEKLTCSNGSISRPDDYWVGYTTPSQHMKSTYGYASNCPSGLCNDNLHSTNISTNLKESSPMCNGGRTGTLCTVCPKGTSVVFGSVDCKKCTNVYILTILFFCTCGILLVTVLFLLQLTVKTGTINGLIFYANLFSTRFTLGYLLQLNSHLYLLQLFIFFLNLDLGFPLCFYDGMNEEVYRLLQFIFPVYVWIIIGVIIYASKHSVRLSKVTGKQSVAVLATLVQLSYAKIITNITESIPYTPIYVNNEGMKNNIESYIVWFAAGVDYGSPLHIVHMIISICFLIIFVIPYTLIAVSAPFLARYKIVSHFMPYLDTIYAPYKEKFRFWFGARLVLLLFQLIIGASLSGNDFRVNLGVQLLSVLTFVLLQIHFKPFKNLFVHLLDVFFMLNFCVIAFFAISLRSGKTLFVIVATLFAGALIVFIGIIVFHICIVFFKKKISEVLPSASNIKKFVLSHRTSSPPRSPDHLSVKFKSRSLVDTVIGKEGTFDALREPILDYCQDVDD